MRKTPMKRSVRNRHEALAQAEQSVDGKAPRIYLSGPMTGKPERNFPAFNAEAQRLRGMGFDVVNPAELHTDAARPWDQCMRADIKALCDCDMLALLPGWMESKGAHLELHIAHRIGLKIVNAAEVEFKGEPREVATC